MKSIRHINTFQGRHIRDTFKDAAIDIVQINTTDAQISPGYLLGVRDEQLPPTGRHLAHTRRFFRVAYCVDGTRNVWKVVEVDGRRITQMDALRNDSEGGRKFQTPHTYLRKDRQHNHAA